MRTDVVAGYVTEERARKGYGVVFDNTGGVDAAATVALRERIAGSQSSLSIVADERHAYTGGKGMRRVVRLNGVTAERLGVVHDALVELRGTHPAPLRAWVRIDDETADGDCPINAFGRRVLGVASGDTVTVRRLRTPQVTAGLAG